MTVSDRRRGNDHLIGWSLGVPRHARSPCASRAVPRGIRASVFFLFSSRLGCLGSLVVSALLTLVLLLVLDVI